MINTTLFSIRSSPFSTVALKTPANHSLPPTGSPSCPWTPTSGSAGCTCIASLSFWSMTCEWTQPGLVSGRYSVVLLVLGKLLQIYRVNPDSLSYPFRLVLRVHVRVRANSGFDRGVGVRGRGRYPLKPSIFTSLLETKSTQNTPWPDHPESIYILSNWFKMTTVLFCALHSHIYIHIYLQPCS